MKPLITGLMLSKIIKEAGVDRNEKDKVKEIMKNVLDSNEPTFLKKKHRCINITGWILYIVKRV